MARARHLVPLLQLKTQLGAYLVSEGGLTAIAQAIAHLVLLNDKKGYTILFVSAGNVMGARARDVGAKIPLGLPIPLPGWCFQVIGTRDESSGIQRGRYVCTDER